MNHETGTNRRRTERLLTLCAAVLAVLLLGSLARLCFLLRTDEEQAAPELPAPEQALAAPEDFLPQSLRLGEALTGSVQDENGTEVTVSELAAESGKGLWLLFWASWCPDCEEQLQSISALEALAAQYQVRLVLIDRLDPARESVEAAQEKLSECGVTALNLYDRDEQLYHGWGMREIPGSLVTDPDGRLKGYASGVLTAGEAEGLLRQLTEGRDAPGRAFVQNTLSDGQGGIYTSTATAETSPSGGDVLCESQGLMLQYALLREDRALFDRVWSKTKALLLTERGCAWYAKASGARADVNALLDDLRVWYALRGAAERWDGDYEAEAKALGAAIAEGCRDSRGRWVDFVDLSNGALASTISLCYLAPDMMHALSEGDPGMEASTKQALRLLQSGRISDSFPLYYSSYDYRKRAYSRDDLNTSEALYTLWNLSRAGLLPPDALDWVRRQVEAGKLAARYDVNGNVVPGYEYHSPAVYALAALIALEEEDAAIFETAHRRMERVHLLDADSPRFGAYGAGADNVYAFDQLLPLLVEGRFEEGVS